MKISKKVSLKNELKEWNDPLEGDLSDFMSSGDWQVTRFELTKPKNKVITLRISEELLNSVKKRAKKLNLDYQRLIRITLESSLYKRT